MEDIIIIGAGILGTTAARVLSRYNLKILVLEQAYDLGEGATKANSAVLAAGYHARGGSLKGISGAKGNRMYEQICKGLGVKVSYPGSLHCAYSAEGMEELKKKMKKGQQNGAEGLRLITGDEARKMQPGLSGEVVGALYAPHTGIIDVFQLLVRSAQVACINGVTFRFDEEVIHITPKDGYYELETGKAKYKARYVINAGGENAALLEAQVRPQELKIDPRRGQFLVFDRKEGRKMKHILYQQQETDEKGCFLALSTDGNIIAGPTSENVSSYRRTETTAWGIGHISKIAKKILPDLDLNMAIASFAGIRTNITNVEKEQKDFVVRISAPRMVSALGIKNPGVTAAPYLMQVAVEELEKEGLSLEEKENYISTLPYPPKFLEASKEQQKELLRKDRAYGKVICRCEKITEGDLKAVLREALPPKSINGLKKRLRVGMGRCQGGFCTPRVIEILAAEWQVPPEKIVKSVKGSMMVKGRMK